MIREDSKLRQCVLNENGEKALFHMWHTIQNVIPPSNMIGGSPGGQIQYTLGLVEREDGSMVEVTPTQIKFLDTKETENDINTLHPAASVVRAELMRKKDWYNALVASILGYLDEVDGCLPYDKMAKQLADRLIGE